MSQMLFLFIPLSSPNHWKMQKPSLARGCLKPGSRVDLACGLWFAGPWKGLKLVLVCRPCEDFAPLEDVREYSQGMKLVIQTVTRAKGAK